MQLYTVRSLVDQDIIQTLESVAKVGYKVVEFAGYGKRTHAEIRSALDRLGMTAPSAHISLSVLRKDLDAQVAIAQTIGHRYITVPSLGGDMPVTADGWKKMAAEFNQIGTKLQAKKIGLAFHSHRDEFMDVGGGKKGMDIFIGETDPKLVTFEIDLGWSWVANQNPVDWMKRYPGRVKMWHVKDILALKGAQDRQMELFTTLVARGQGAAPAPRGAGGGPGASCDTADTRRHRRPGAHRRGRDRLQADLRGMESVRAGVLLRRAGQRPDLARRSAGGDHDQLPQPGEHPDVGIQGSRIQGFGIHVLGSEPWNSDPGPLFATAPCSRSTGGWRRRRPE